MPLPSRIVATVVYDSSSKRCVAGCGLDWTTDVTPDAIKRQLAARFGDTVRLELLDMTSGDRRTGPIRERIKKDDLVLPLLLVNGEVRITGEFDARQLMDAIEVETELKWNVNTT